MPSKERPGSRVISRASVTSGSPGETPTRPSPTSTSARTPTVTWAARAASESCCAASALSSATVTRVRRAIAINRSSFDLPITGYATSMSGVPESSITSASPTLATVRPAAPRSNCSRPTAGDLCVLVCGRRRRPWPLAYSATRQRLRSIMSSSISSAGVSISEMCIGGLSEAQRDFARRAGVDQLQVLSLLLLHGEIEQPGGLLISLGLVQKLLVEELHQRVLLVPGTGLQCGLTLWCAAATAADRPSAGAHRRIAHARVSAWVAAGISSWIASPHRSALGHHAAATAAILRHDQGSLAGDLTRRVGLRTLAVFIG